MGTYSNLENNMKIRNQKNQLIFLLLPILMLLVSLSVMAEDLIFQNSFEDNRELVKGSASGISSSGLILKLFNGFDTEFLPVNSNGVFSFSSLIEIDTTWSAGINAYPNDPEIQTCQLTNSSGVMAQGGVNNLLVSCDAPVSKWNEMNWDSASWN